MPTESIWTALPTGRGRANLTVSVHVTPRLTSPSGADGTLADHPAFLQWPPTDLTFDVVVGGVTYPASEVTVVSTPDPAVWAALFPPSSPVRSHVPVDRSATAIHTVPTSKIVAFLKARYTELAIGSPEDYPLIDDLLAGGFEDIGFHGRTGQERWEAVSGHVAGLIADNKVIDTRAPSSATFDFVQLEDFFASLDGDDPLVAAAYATPVEPPRLDVHDVIQFVNQHPALMRLLGLVLDLEVRTTSAPLPAGATTIQVLPQAAVLAGTTARAPLTHVTVTPNAVGARPRPGSTHLVPGWMRLDDASQFDVVTVDADGGGLKAVDFAGNLQSRVLHPTEDSPTDSAVPTLRHDGFSVTRIGKAAETQAAFVAGAAKEAALAADALELYLDDIVRGVRVDVWDSRSTRWHSVMERTGTYELAGQTLVVPVTDEGFLGTTASAKLLSDDLYLGEEVFWWDGWSLVVPRPGRALTTDPDADDPLIDRPANLPGPDFDARIHFDVVGGSLPRLRFGFGYRFRARLVDLAGNSRPPDDPDDTHATAPVTFGRFEPPASPPVLLRTPLGPGESVETVVLRSGLYDEPAAPATAERHLVPSKIGQIAVEHHGLVDRPDPDPGLTTYDLLADLDDANLLNHEAIDPGTGDRNRWYDTDALVPTWAPDPTVDHVALRVLDGPHAGHRELVRIGSMAAWPNYRSSRLVLVEGDDPPKHDPTTGVLTVPLAKADIVHARVGSVIDRSLLDQFGLWHWINEVLPPGPSGDQVRGDLAERIRTGRHWMFEPYRVLTLVHAVRQPLLTPEFVNGISPSRPQGATYARLRGTLGFDRHSTVRVDALASWREPVDGGPGSPPPADVDKPQARVVVDQTAFTLGIEYDGPGLLPTSLAYDERHELGDTKHRMITYRALATTRFPEHFTSSATFSFAGPGSTAPLDTGSPALGVVPGSVKLSSTDSSGGPIGLIEGIHFGVDPTTGVLAFGDGAAGGFPPVGADIAATYLVPPITRETVTPQLVSIPSSARPAAPKLRYVIPTFGWEDEEITAGGEVVGLSSTRRGNGVRIYLERPWWSSGEGELLGVVLWPPAEQPDPPDPEDADDPALDADRRRPFVTMWGQDPIYASRSLPSRFPRLASFPEAVDTDTSRTLAELDSDDTLPVNVAGHTVAFDFDSDSGRDLWYCDLTVAAGPAYSPMIRLALARWQRESISDTHLSRVVMADIVQLAPDRVASVFFDELDDTLVGVTLSGPTHTKTAAQGGSDPGSARVIVEQHQPGFDGGLAWQPVGDAIELTATVLNGTGQWTGEVQLPGPRAPGMWRLIVEQYELLAAEPFEKGNQQNPFITIPIPTPRLVHTDIIPL